MNNLDLQRLEIIKYISHSHEKTAAMFMIMILVWLISPVVVELFSYENTFFCSNTDMVAFHVSENAVYCI